MRISVSYLSWHLAYIQTEAAESWIQNNLRLVLLIHGGWSLFLPMWSPLLAGCMLCFGQSAYFRFNHPEEAVRLKNLLPGGLSTPRTQPTGKVPVFIDGCVILQPNSSKLSKHFGSINIYLCLKNKPKLVISWIGCPRLTEYWSKKNGTMEKYEHILYLQCYAVYWKVRRYIS